MAWIQDDLDALKDAIKTGARKVKYADKEVEYRSLDEMIIVKNMIEQELGTVTPATTRIFATHSKGV